MIQIDSKKRYLNSPKKLSNASCLKLIANAIALGKGDGIVSRYNDKQVKAALRSAHGDKCVYCESIPIATSAFRTDHFRPKDKVNDIDPKDHNGYYWLGYEWSNFLQSCESCNGKKSNKFPLKKGSKRIHPRTHTDAITKENRVINSALLSIEERLLLHPELDKVEDYFVFESDGKITGLEEEGQKSAEVYGLNRQNLILMRKKKIDRFWNELIDILNDFEDRGGDNLARDFLYFDLVKFFKKLLREQDKKEEYSRLGFFMFHDFESFYLNRLPPELEEHKQIVRDIYLTIKR